MPWVSIFLVEVSRVQPLKYHMCAKSFGQMKLSIKMTRDLESSRQLAHQRLSRKCLLNSACVKM